MIIRKLLFVGILMGWIGCGKTNIAPNMPNVAINEQLNLTNIQYNNLRQDKGYVYFQAGVRGLIIIRVNASQYLALERNCPYQPTDACAKVEVDQSGLFLKDPCCGSQFDLFGQVSAGPARYPMRQYATSLNGNFLYIKN